MTEDDRIARTGLAVTVTTAWALVVGLIHVRVFPIDVSRHAKVLTLVAAGAAAAWIRGASWRSRFVHLVPFLAHAGTLALITCWYVRLRSALTIFDLVVPTAIASTACWPLFRRARRLSAGEGD